MIHFKLVEIGSFKKVLSSASTLFKEARIYFKPELFCFSALDDSISALVYCQLSSHFFDEYTCDEDKEICVFLPQIINILQSAEKKDSLELNLLNDKILELQIENDYKRDFKLVTLNFDPDSKIPLPNIEKDLHLIINSNVFNNIINDISKISEDFEIISQKDEIIFSGSGVYGEVKISLKEKNPMIELLKIRSKIENKYDVLFLQKIVKESWECSNLCEIITQLESPIKIIFNIEDKGVLTFYLSSY